MTPGRIESEQQILRKRNTRRRIGEMGEAAEEIVGKWVSAFGSQ